MTTSDPFDAAPICALVGPTASGKTALAMDVARAAGAEVISMDSMLVYRELGIGTAKPSPEELAEVPHHLIDLVSVNELFDVSQWLKASQEALADCLARDRRVLFVGGTGFFLAALLRGLFQGPAPDPELRARLEQTAQEEGGEVLVRQLGEIDPESAERIHPKDLRRVIRALEVFEQTGRTLSDWQQEWGVDDQRQKQARILGLHMEVPAIDLCIRARTELMIEAGWQAEALAARAIGFSKSSAQALGYAEILAWADGEATREETVERIALATRQFARRQRTWYRKFPIEWVDPSSPQLTELALTHVAWD